MQSLPTAAGAGTGSSAWSPTGCCSSPAVDVEFKSYKLCNATGNYPTSNPFITLYVEISNQHTIFFVKKGMSVHAKEPHKWPFKAADQPILLQLQQM